MADWTYTKEEGDTAENAVVTRSGTKTETMNIPELIGKIAGMEEAARGKIESRDHFIDMLQAVVDDTGLRVDVPVKLELTEVEA
tara:strand:+ start:493 stop:744 length:252 start_codon:yes stop_codon:yes gene_type:complete